ncbi:leucine rich repeat domain protein [Aspergillus taichungensis]|uniref:Leucine rich repeat domain protein n=1 Tax=Aspergillus taichungensis TaxID=482145 RepID=A0A2J5I356_9EURO|nr:leucine rich repeat domain protein [Aspergillus taichungensis]
MDIIPPSYQSATARDAWSIIARYIPSRDLCAVCLVCRRWHELFVPFLWGDPASHFGTDNDAVYVALTRFRRTLKYARPEVRMLTHTLHLPPALSEIYGGPRPEWLREVLDFLPYLQSLLVSKLPFFDHNAMVALRNGSRQGQSPDGAVSQVYNVRLLLADREPNTTSVGLAETLLRFQDLVYLDLSYTTPARDQMVLSAMSQLEHLQVLKLRAIGLRDKDAEFLANAIGTRVRYLDLRDNLLTDMSVRSLLQACFQPANSPATLDSTVNPMSSVPGSRPHLLSMKLLESPDLDEQFIKSLTQPLVGHSWVEGLPHVGITHLYLADNQITVEGAAGLLSSSRLHALDVGNVDTVGSLAKGQHSLSPSPQEPRDLPGAEKLIPILGSVAKDKLTYLRAHHAICTTEVHLKDLSSSDSHDLLPELSATEETEVSGVIELPANEVHELPTGDIPIFELEDTEVQGPSESALPVRRPVNIYEDEPLSHLRRGSTFAPEVLEPADASESAMSTMHPSYLGLSNYPGTPESIPQCASPISIDDPRTHRIQELLAKRPRNQTLPRRDHKQTNFPHLHPSHIPHLETLVLTDVPSHVQPGSPILTSLIRFITACSNESLLATLQAGSDYSLPPGQARAQAELERARSLFSLRRLILEITPTNLPNGPTALTGWKSVSAQTGAGKSSTGDRDSENLWSAGAADFSFFDNDECGIPENDPGKYFPMAVLNEKVTLLPDEDDSAGSDPDATSSSLSPGWRRARSRPNSLGSVPPAAPYNNSDNVIHHVPEIDLVAELASFRRGRKVEYEDAVRRDRHRRSTMSPLSMSSTTATAATAASPVMPFVEGHWKGEVKVVRNPAPKGRSGVVDMYGNYFEKGYLYP